MNEIVDNIVPIDDKVDKKEGASDRMNFRYGFSIFGHMGRSGQ